MFTVRVIVAEMESIVFNQCIIYATYSVGLENGLFNSGFPVINKVGNAGIFIYCLNLKISWIEKSTTAILIQSIMTNVNSLWNSLGTQLFPIYFH